MIFTNKKYELISLFYERQIIIIGWNS